MSGKPRDPYREKLKSWQSNGYEARINDAVRSLQKSPDDEKYLGLDLLALFRMPADPSSLDVAAHWKKLNMDLNKVSSFLGVAGSIQQLWKAGSEIVDGWDTPAFWESLGEAQREAQMSQLSQTVQDLQSSVPFNVVTGEMLDQALVSSGLETVGLETAKRVCEEKGLDVVPAIDAPAETALTRKLKAADTQVLDTGAKPTIIHTLLYAELADPPPNSITFVNRLAIGSKQIGIDNVSESHKRLAAAPQDRDYVGRAKAYLGALLAELKKTEDPKRALREVVQASIFGQLQKRMQRKALPDAIIREFTNYGLNRTDVQRMLLLLFNTAGNEQVRGIEYVRQLMSEGRYEEALRVLEAMPDGSEDDAERDRLRAEVDGRISAKARLVEEGRRARSELDFALARRKFTEAYERVPDSETQELLDSLPPEPANNVNLSVSGNRMQVSWNASTDPGVSYRVLRSTNSVRNAHDGTVIISDTRETTATDDFPAAGVRRIYTVLATRDGNNYSLPATADIVYLPQPTNVRTSVSEDAIGVVWEVPSGSTTQVTAECVGEQARKLDAGNQRQISLTGLQRGKPYQISLTACYKDGKQTLFSAPQVITAVPRGKAEAITDFSLAADNRRGTSYVFHWRSTPDYRVEIWSAPPQQRVPVGSKVSEETLSSLGRQHHVDIHEEGHGRSCGIVSDIRTIAQIFPVIVADDGYLLGNIVLAGPLPELSGVTVSPRGSHLHIAWIWPEQRCAVIVNYTVKGAAEQQKITKAQYDADGGVSIPRRGLTSLTIQVSVLESGRWMNGPLTPVEIPADEKLQLGYHLKIKKSLFGTGTALIRVEGPAGARADAVLVQSASHFMPMTISDGLALSQLSIILDDSGCYEARVTLGKFKSPYWVRLLAADPDSVLLADPPTHQLKG